MQRAPVRLPVLRAQRGPAGAGYAKAGERQDITLVGWRAVIVVAAVTGNGNYAQ